MASGHEVYSETLFIDSGAFTLYNNKVVAPGERHDGVKGARPRARFFDPFQDSDRQRADVSYYSLKKGSAFLDYCNSYAAFIKTMMKKEPGMLFANIDVILNPELSWQIQQFFQKEHGLRPVPIVHCGTPMKYVDRYLHYPLLGVGGFASSSGHHTYLRWGNEFFRHICPKANDYLPIIRVHGFAMTSWNMICRYPWWSVDSTTWCRVSGFGSLYVPRWSEKKGFRFDVPPFLINFSPRSPTRWDGQRHYLGLRNDTRVHCNKWLDHLGLAMGSTDKEGKIVEYGVASHHKARYIANLHYLKDLEESRPKWPHPLDNNLIKRSSDLGLI